MDFLNRIKGRAELRRLGEYRSYDHVRRGVGFLQHDQNIGNADGATVRADLNNALVSLFSTSSGTAAPSTTVAYQFWADTTNNLLKRRNAANTGWLVICSLDESFVLSRSSNTILGISDVGKVIRATSSFTQTFSAVATLGDGWFVDYINDGTGNITFDPNSTETINGQTTLQFAPGESGRIVCNGSNLRIIKRSRYHGAIGVGRNIAARTNAATPNTKIDASADEIQLKNAAGEAFVALAVSVTVDFGTTGANGLDTGVQALSTWYYIWIIAKEDGTIAGLGSTSATAPTMPSGYIYKALISAARSDGSTHFIKYRQVGNRAYFEVSQNVLGSGSSAVEAAVTITSFVPSIAEEFFVHWKISGSHDGSGVFDMAPMLRVITGVELFDATDRMRVYQSGTGASAGKHQTMPSIWLPNTGNLYYYVSTGSGSGGAVTIDVAGFKLPLGGE